MRVLITGAEGFIGQNLCYALKNIASGLDRRSRFDELHPLTIYEVDRDSADEQLDKYCRDADFVFCLAGANRPKNDSEFDLVNRGATATLLERLEAHGNNCPIMLASSIQASLEGKFKDSAYGKSKREAERLIRDHSARCGAKSLIFRFPNVYGKWCRPNYNSVVATFCHNIARDIPIKIDDPTTCLTLLYIDDLVECVLQALIGHEQYEIKDGQEFCVAGPADVIELGQIAQMIQAFHTTHADVFMPSISENSFAGKLFATYESYIPPEKAIYSLRSCSDNRGSFTEILRTENAGQISLNTVHPRQTKGNHWHNTKWEKFIVVAGVAEISMRRMGRDRDGSPYPINTFYVSEDELRVVDMLPGYTHSIKNISETENLSVLIWASELFNADDPDTFAEEV